MGELEPTVSDPKDGPDCSDQVFDQGRNAVFSPERHRLAPAQSRGQTIFLLAMPHRFNSSGTRNGASVSSEKASKSVVRCGFAAPRPVRKSRILQALVGIAEIVRESPSTPHCGLTLGTPR